MEGDETSGTKVIDVVNTKKIKRWDHSRFLTHNRSLSQIHTHNFASCRSRSLL